MTDAHRDPGSPVFIDFDEWIRSPSPTDGNMPSPLIAEAKSPASILTKDVASNVSFSLDNVDQTTLLTPFALSTDPEMDSINRQPHDLLREPKHSATVTDFLIANSSRSRLHELPSRRNRIVELDVNQNAMVPDGPPTIKTGAANIGRSSKNQKSQQYQKQVIGRGFVNGPASVSRVAKLDLN